MKLYTKNIDLLTESELIQGYNQMSPERKAYVDGFNNIRAKAPRIVADMLAREAIADFCSISTDEITFAKTPEGKPYVLNADIHFSISHSEKEVICAVSDYPIGADIEKIRAVHPKSASRFATESELDFINKKPENFFKIWTLKEAYFKCIGTGLGADIKNISFDISDGSISANIKGFEFSFHNVADGYICSICQKISE